MPCQVMAKAAFNGTFWKSFRSCPQAAFASSPLVLLMLAVTLRVPSVSTNARTWQQGCQQILHSWAKWLLHKPSQFMQICLSHLHALNIPSVNFHVSKRDIIWGGISSIKARIFQLLSCLALDISSMSHPVVMKSCCRFKFESSRGFLKPSELEVHTKTSTYCQMPENSMDFRGKLTDALVGRWNSESAMGLYGIMLTWRPKFQWWSKSASSSACCFWSLTPAATQPPLSKQMG